MSDLPPLPDSFRADRLHYAEEVYLADQMRAYAESYARAAVAAERERNRLRILGLQANYDDPACRAALKHAAAYVGQDDAAAILREPT